jgi:hypothetical protein
MRVVFDDYIIILKTKGKLDFSTDHDFIAHGDLCFFLDFDDQD